MLATGALEPGTVFAGRYRVLNEIARGGMGAVHRAEHVETEQVVALKVLFPQVLSGAGAVDRFRLEARVAGRLQNEHVVRVYDAGIDSQSGLAFIVMELLVGETLQRRVDLHGALGPTAWAPLILQLGDALEAAHSHVDRSGELRPIVHRDLKPDNLFLTSRPNGELLLKVLDFGIAKMLASDGTVSRETRGTPMYMAFEQVAGETIDPRTDIWAVGLIAFFALFRQHYWRNARADTATPLYGEILHGELLPASVRVQQLGLSVPVPAGFDAWFARCVVRDPDKRFASAREACTSLARLLDPSLKIPERTSIVVAPTTDVSPETALATTLASAPEATAARPVRRRGLWVVGAALFAALAGAALVLSRRESSPAPTGSASAPPATAAVATASATPDAGAPAASPSLVPATSTSASAPAPIVTAPTKTAAPKAAPAKSTTAKSADVWEER